MIKPGNILPHFILNNQDGQKVDSNSLLGEHRLVIYFYPKDFTPGCTAESCSFRDSMVGFEQLNARIIGISSDSVATHRKFADLHRLQFTLLSDPGNIVRKAFGVKNAMLGLVPGRSTFVVDIDGIVRFRTDHLGNAAAHVAEAKAALEAMDENEGR